jgi:hypothetical protein
MRRLERESAERMRRLEKEFADKERFLDEKYSSESKGHRDATARLSDQVDSQLRTINELNNIVSDHERTICKLEGCCLWLIVIFFLLRGGERKQREIHVVVKGLPNYNIYLHTPISPSFFIHLFEPSFI